MPTLPRHLAALALTFALPTATAIAQAPSKQALAAAAEYAEAHRGHALLVWHRDTLRLEAYTNGWSARRPHYLASGTKSFTGLMAAAAVDDGFLALDEPVAATIGEWKADPRRSRITIRQLLSLTSGIDGGEIGLRPDPTREMLALPARWEPGTTFRYAQAPFQVFHEVMRRKLAAHAPAGTTPLTPVAWLEQRLLAPLGATVPRWSKASDGTPSLAGGASMTARDWGALGRLLLARGAWNGKPLVRPATFAQLVNGSAALPAYGVGFWLNAPLPAGSISPDEFVPAEVGRAGGVNAGAEAILPGGPRDLFMAAGAGFQRLYVIPSRDLVVVRFGDDLRSARRRGARAGDTFADAEFLARLLELPLPDDRDDRARPRRGRAAGTSRTARAARATR